MRRSGKTIYELDVQRMDHLRASALAPLVGSKAADKFIPEVVWHGGPGLKRAFLMSLFEGDGGVLGNSGPLSQAALPGAVVGAWYVATRRGVFWHLGLVAFLLFACHSGLAPVYAGGLAATLALLTSSFLSPWAKDRAQVRRRLGLLTAATVFALFALPGRDASAPVAADGTGATGATEASRASITGGRMRLVIIRRPAPHRCRAQRS